MYWFSGPKPFRGRFNPKLQKRPERTGDGTWLDHQAWTKIVMAGMIGIIVYFTIHRPANHETPLAKQSEFLNGKRSQNTVCPPSYKNEIQNLGNESKYLQFRSWINGYTRLLNFRKNPLYPLLFESTRLLLISAPKLKPLQLQ